MARKPMSRTLKATLASGAAIVLLAGVGGTFARWYDDAEVTTGTIEAGELSLTADAVTFAVSTEGGTGPSTPIADISAFNMVPGDIVTVTSEVTPVLVGDNLVATLTADLDGAATGTLATFVTSDVSVDGAADAELTEADSGTAIDVEIEITLPFTTGGEPGGPPEDGDGTDAQNTTLDLTALTLSLVQNDRP